MTPVRIGLAGYGRGGRCFHAPLPVDPRDAVAALEVLDAARLSAARGDVVRLSRGR